MQQDLANFWGDMGYSPINFIIANGMVATLV